MDILRKIAHWSAYAFLLYVFGYASIFKVLQLKDMVNGMQMLGFDKNWTLAIGIGELLGWIALLVGLKFRAVKNIAALYLFPFGVGALTAHFAHAEFSHYHNALFATISAVAVVVLDKNFKISF
jgi:uncharacterized membrane protein YphA (DoxX/SURF4 family)